jgi:hypothetical protein
MEDDALGPADVTGRWTGLYRYRSESRGNYPIVAELRQEGSLISGEMYDQITESSDTLANILEHSAQDISPRERWSAKVAFSPEQAQSIVVSWRLPDTSDIEGRVAGNQVRFKKIYRGLYEHTSAIRGREIGSVIRHAHTVHYSGQVDHATGCISGQWVVRRRGILARFLPPQSRGFFELYKKS